MAFVTQTIKAPIGRDGRKGEMRLFDIRIDDQTGEPDRRQMTPEGLAAWDWHEQHRQEETDEPR